MSEISLRNDEYEVRKRRETYPFTAHLVVDMITQLSSLGTFTCTNAEHGIGYKASPFMVLHIFAERVTKQ